MLSEKLESLANWLADNVEKTPLRDVLVSQLNSFAADAHELERQVVPPHARVTEETGNVVMLDKRRAQ